jgi:hypothetical protein
MIVEFTKSFDKQFQALSPDLQDKAKSTIDQFIDAYASRQFPKALRVHKCGSFVSVSISMKHRIFILPILNGIKFVFVGDHQTADNYLKK